MIWIVSFQQWQCIKQKISFTTFVWLSMTILPWSMLITVFRKIGSSVFFASLKILQKVLISRHKTSVYILNRLFVNVLVSIKSGCYAMTGSICSESIGFGLRGLKKRDHLFVFYHCHRWLIQLKSTQEGLWRKMLNHIWMVTFKFK